MENRKLDHVNLVSRILLGFLFFYHGLVPKILWLSPIEVDLVSGSGIGISANLISPLAGISEILLGGAILFFQKSNAVIYAAAASLVLLLLYVGLINPRLLIEAFNPVTTNILGLGLCYIILITGSRENV